ncbi:MAG: hypothetical protein FWH38_06700 [Treponema sp.]|nr:hypothetical protein [Treponema sp.]
MRKIYTSFLSLAILFMLSCRQDPIFYTISTETAPQDARIKGSPTNMVIFEREYPDPEDENNPAIKVPILYVASGRLYWYAKSGLGTGTPRWDSAEYSISQPGGKIIALAATNSYLYALCLTGHNVDTALWRIGPSDVTWERAGLSADGAAASYPLIQSIYADPQTERLFAGSRRTDKIREYYAILYLDTADLSLKLLQGDVAMLSGAAYRQQEDLYYLSTKGAGIYQVAETALAANNISETAVVQLADNSDISEGDRKPTRQFMNIIRLKDTAESIIAIERDGGYIYKVNNGSFERMKYTGIEQTGNWILTGKYATGAFAFWTDDPDPLYGNTMLVVGIQGSLYNTTTSSYTHGYVEFDLISDGSALDGSFNTASVRRDPGRLQSVSDNDRYTATLGKHPVNHLLQVPRGVDDNIIFFASTQTAGLWSYRYLANNGGFQWNAEN